MEQYTKQYTEQEMDEIGIDPKIRGLVRNLQFHGYKTMHSCAGHAPEKQKHYVFDRETGRDECIGETLNPNTRYVSCKEGTGDGWLEKNASNLGFERVSKIKLLDRDTGERVSTLSYYAKEASTKYSPNEESNFYRREAA